MSKLDRVHKWLVYWNNLLLIPLFTVMVLEFGTEGAEALDFEAANLFFCAFFLAEWLLALKLSEDRRKFLFHGGNLLDLASSIPFSSLFQGLRVARLFRVLRLVRIAMRARRFRGRGKALIRATGVVAATVCAGAFGLRIVEPETVPTFMDALWWSTVTVSTVGYGDVVPLTTVGRIVGMVLLFFGVGVFGYVAGFTTSLLSDVEEDEMYRTLLLVNGRLGRIEDALGVGEAEPD